MEYMKSPESLLEQNKKWAADVLSKDSDFFQKLSLAQSPKYLWIGCSDSRVPANQIVGLLPGEIFVHRNVANLVVHTDFNCLSVIQYAVEVLKVEHIIVCGHYGCGGIIASQGDSQLGLIDNWLRHVRDVSKKHEAELTAIANQEQRFKRLTELNVAEQVKNVYNTTILEQARRVGQEVSVHGWIYGIDSGLIKDLGVKL